MDLYHNKRKGEKIKTSNNTRLLTMLLLTKTARQILFDKGNRWIGHVLGHNVIA